MPAPRVHNHPTSPPGKDKSNVMNTALEPACYLEPTQDSGRAFMMRGIEGPVVMLNLLRFREVADYSATPELAPAAPISGAEAYDRYVAHTLPFLEESGGEMMFLGTGGPFLIGPSDEHWDSTSRRQTGASGLQLSHCACRASQS